MLPAFDIGESYPLWYILLNSDESDYVYLEGIGTRVKDIKDGRANDLFDDPAQRYRLYNIYQNKQGTFDLMFAFIGRR